MPSKNPAQRLRDIIDNIAAIGDFTAGMDFDAFHGSRRTIYAVTRALEIISEATRRLPAEMKARYTDLDWSAIAAAGNVYRHDYETVDDALIWHTVKHGLDRLDNAARIELDQLGD